MLLIDYDRKPQKFNFTAATEIAPEKRKARRLTGLIEVNRGQIVNLRPKLKRNKKVSIAGVVDKFKRFPQNKFPIPHDTIDNRRQSTKDKQLEFAK